MTLSVSDKLRCASHMYTASALFVRLKGERILALAPGDGGRSNDGSEKLKQKKSNVKESSEKNFARRLLPKWRPWRGGRLCLNKGYQIQFMCYIPKWLSRKDL